MIPFIFSSLAIAAVGRAAMDMVQEVRRQFKEIPGIMEHKAEPEYEKCVEISTKASIREMLAPGAIALVVPILVGFTFGPEVLCGLLAGVTVSGVLMGIFQNNAGGAWDNAKKSFEKGVMVAGKMQYKGSEPHKASVTGDTVGDPFKDTSGPSMNILIKLMSIVSLVIAPHISEGGHHSSTPVEDKAMTQTVSEWSGLQNGTYSFTEGSVVRWSASKVGGSHYGNVNLIGGTVTIQDGKIQGGEMIMDMKSITVLDIDNQEDKLKLEGHLRSDDFFGVDAYPESVIVLQPSNEPGLEQQTVGELTIKGITKELPVLIGMSPTENGLQISSSVKVDRTEYGIKYKSKKFDSLLDNFIYDEFEVKTKLLAVKK
jgi:polyisoprenoid-binding protein YceI